MIPSPAPKLFNDLSTLLHQDRSYPKGAKAKRFGHAALLPHSTNNPLQRPNQLPAGLFLSPALFTPRPRSGPEPCGAPAP